MKKSVKILISIVLVLALGAAGTFGYLYFSKDKMNDNGATDSQNPGMADAGKFDCDDYVATVNGISVIADDTGVRIFNESDQTQKVIFDKPAEQSMFDGETAYFIELGVEDYKTDLYDWDGNPLSQDEDGPWLRGKIHSYNLKTDELKEVILTNDDSALLVYADESGIYYADTKDADVGIYGPSATRSFYKYDIANQKRTVLLDDMAWYSVQNGKLFYQTEAITGSGEDGYHPLYVYDFKSGYFKRISEQDGNFLKYEGDEVFFMERICNFTQENDEIKYTLKSFNLKNNETQVVAELDFLPDDLRIWASFEDSENILISGIEFDGVLYNLKEKSYKVVGEPEKEGYIETVGSHQLFVETLYAFDEEVQAELSSGIAIHLCDGNNYKLVTKIEDKNAHIVKITENGVYTESTHYDETLEGFTPVEIEFLPLEIK